MKFLQKINIVNWTLILTTIIITAHCSKSKSKNAFKIVSLSPAMTEIIFSLGAGDKVVGVTTYCDYPEATKEIYKVGDFSNPSIERIVALKPDLVVVNLPEQRRIKNELDKLEINIFVSSPKSLDDIYREIHQIGKMLKLENDAESLVHYMQRQIKPVASKTTKRVYVEISPRPLITIGASTFLNELLEYAGGQNIFSDLRNDYPVVSQEETIRKNPQIIILLHPENIEYRMGWRNVTAIKNRKVYKDLNPDLLLRPGPRLVQGFEALKRIIIE